ncbi:MAG: TldD/PmbA family protein [Candidatus Bathyarchaeota archaeon]|nr:MAG: TldD/PmbA family protein [Candidatus Bathyarchaeota archaeon]
MMYENLKDELLSTVDSGLKYARTVDNEAEFELYLFYQNRAVVNITQGVVEASEGIVKGNAVRVASQNSVSFASSSGISIDRIRRSVSEAMASLRSVSIKDERFSGFCTPEKPGREGAFTREILDLSKEELIDYAGCVVKEGQEFDRRIKTVGSECSAEWGGFAVGNTQGLQQSSRSALNSCEVYCIAVNGEERRASYEFDTTRERLINTGGLGKKAAQRAISLLGAKKLSATTVLPTIWEPRAASAYILFSLGQSVRGEHVVEGRSPIADKVGEEIASPKLTITDNGQNPSGINTEAIDAEGHPQKKTTIIDRGELSQFLFDTYYARIHNSESTGNCSRRARATTSYETSPFIRPKNLEVKPGSKNLDSLIATTDEQAILIADAPLGLRHSNVSTGEFSAVAQNVFLVENGDKKWPLQPVSVSGNFYIGFKQLLNIGGDLTKTVFAVETPTLVFDGFSVVG